MRKHLGISAEEWFSTAWDIQKMYLEGLADDKLITLGVAPEETWENVQGGGPQRRTVDTGADVIDLAAMKRELEAARAS